METGPRFKVSSEVLSVKQHVRPRLFQLDGQQAGLKMTKKVVKDKQKFSDREVK